MPHADDRVVILAYEAFVRFDVDVICLTDFKGQKLCHYSQLADQPPVFEV